MLIFVLIGAILFLRGALHRLGDVAFSAQYARELAARHQRDGGDARQSGLSDFARPDSDRGALCFRRLDQIAGEKIQKPSRKTPRTRAQPAPGLEKTAGLNGGL